MSMLVQITDDNDHQITFRVSGPYNTDALDDMTSRALRLYKESLKERVEMLGAALAQQEDDNDAA